MASIVKKELNSGIQFQVRYRINGKQRTKCFTSKGKNVTAVRNVEREANRFLKEIEAQLALGIAKDSSNMTFEEYAKIVFAKRDRNAAPKTLANRKSHLKVVNEHIGHIRLKDLDAIKIELFLTEISKIKNDPTIKRYKEILNIVLEEATTKNLIPFNPMTKVKFHISNKPTREVTPVEDEILNIYLEHTKEVKKYYFAIRAMEMSGMRVGEVTAIEKTDFDFEKEEFYIYKSRRQAGELAPTKKGRKRKGIFHSAFQELYWEIIYWQEENKRKFGDAYQENNLLICNEDGTPIKYSALKSYMQRLDKRIGIKIRPHQMRHTFISNLIVKENMNVKDVQLLVGHAKAQTTLNTYTKLFGGKFETSTREKLESIYANKYKKEGHN